MTPTTDTPPGGRRVRSPLVTVGPVLGTGLVGETAAVWWGSQGLVDDTVAAPQQPGDPTEMRDRAAPGPVPTGPMSHAAGEAIPAPGETAPAP